MAGLFPTFEAAKTLETNYNLNRSKAQEAVRAEQFLLRIGAFEPNIKPHLIAPSQSQLDRFVVREFDNVVWGLVRRPAVNSPNYNKIPHEKGEKGENREKGNSTKERVDEKRPFGGAELNKTTLVQLYGSPSNIPFLRRPMLWTRKDLVKISFVLLFILLSMWIDKTYFSR